MAAHRVGGGRGRGEAALKRATFTLHHLIPRHDHGGFDLGRFAIEPVQTTIGLCVCVANSGELTGLDATGHLIPDHENDDEDQQGCYNDASDHQDHCATQELAVDRLALWIVIAGDELYTAYNVGGSKGGGSVIPDCQDAQVVLHPWNKVAD